ncbi:MAG TPA: 5'/3'-nucleotidase SurE [Longimicrobium sp.]|nr:5'/3'-nucleotidase SurE [Longimicrobium sp.]
MLILCTNDDGYLAPGLGVLADAARTLGAEVHVVAPDREQSATSHSLTMHLPIRSREVGENTHYVTGTPTDCVLLAVEELLPRRPDFVLSGVNHGMNMGEDVLYSGTVSAAMEATMLGIPAVAFSYAGRDFQHLASYRPLLEKLLPQLVRPSAFPLETLLNVNLPPIPADTVKGVKVTRLGRRVFSDILTRGKDPSGKPYYWIGGGSVKWKTEEGTDFHAVDAGYVSATPLHLDLTNHALISEVAAWGLGI